MIFRQLFDPETSTYTYLLGDEKSGEACLVDPVIDQVERDVKLLSELNLTLSHTLDTHVHADHISGSGMLREMLGSQVVLSERSGSSQASLYVKDGDHLGVGALDLEVRETPGHTDGCISLVVHEEGMVFTGDALLIRGCGRTDFQQGDAGALYHSIHEKIFSLPGETNVYPGHDYRGHRMSTVAEERAHNPRVGAEKSEAEFVAIMDALKLARPKKIDEAVPANLYAGLPAPDNMAGESLLERRWAPIERSAGGIAEVSVEWVKKHPKVARRIDVRAAAELVGELGKLEDIDHIPLERMSEESQGWDHEEPLVIICRSGGRSGKATVDLEAAGFKRVVSMRGGMRAYRAGGPE